MKTSFHLYHFTPLGKTKEQEPAQFANMDVITESYILLGIMKIGMTLKNGLNNYNKESLSKEKYLKTYFVYGNSKHYNEQARQTESEKIGTE